jgi:hypothetical protein
MKTKAMDRNLSKQVFDSSLLMDPISENFLSVFTEQLLMFGLTGGLVALSSVFVVTNSLPLQLQRSETGRNR